MCVSIIGRQKHRKPPPQHPLRGFCLHCENNKNLRSQYKLFVALSLKSNDTLSVSIQKIFLTLVFDGCKVIENADFCI